jgi:uncharacterized membrane protein YecN with MAPEG domain
MRAVMPVPVVALYGSLNAIFNIYLANRVSTMRRKVKVGIGTSGDKSLELAVRIHANNAEFVPLALVMLLVAELQGGHSAALHALGGTLLVGRMLHAYGMPRKAPNVPRFVGTAATWTTILVTSVWVLVMRFTQT